MTRTRRRWRGSSTSKSTSLLLVNTITTRTITIDGLHLCEDLDLKFEAHVVVSKSVVDEVLVTCLAQLDHCLGLGVAHGQ